jgi:hypothetical protein
MKVRPAMTIARAARRGVGFAVVAALSIVALAWLDVVAALAYVDYSAATPAPGVSARPLHLVVLGDSLAYGTGKSSTRGWIERFRGKLSSQSPATVVVNLAAPGARIAQVSARIPNAGDDATDVALVVAGTNDVLSLADPFGLALDEYGLLARIRRLYPHAAIVVVNVPDMSRAGGRVRIPGGSHPSGLALRAFSGLVEVDNFVLERMAHHFGARIVDIHGVRARSRGYALLGDRAWPAVARALDVPG